MDALETKRIAYCHLEPLTARSAGSIFAASTCRGLAEIGLDPMLVVPAPKPADELPFDVRYIPQPKPVGPLRPSWSRLLFRGMRNAIASDDRTAFVIARDIRLALFLKRELPQIRIIYEAHNFYGDLKRKWSIPPREKGKLKRERRLARLEPKLMELCDGVIFLTNSMKGVFEKRYPLPPHVVAPSGCDWVPEPVDPPRSATVAYIGRLYPNKGVELLLDAVARSKSARLRIIGEGPEQKRLEDRANRLAIADRVEFRGWVPHGELKEALHGIRAVVLCQIDTFYNRYLTSPMKAFDAVACGIPLIFADLPCLAEFLEDERHGLKFKPEDADSLARAIDRLIADDGLWSKLASNLPELAERFLWRSRAEKIAELIGAIGNRRNEG